jgi:outer membrane receptor for ferrienterochelin and colicins
VESSLTWRPSASWDLSASYTYTKTRDRHRGLELTRRPRDILRLGADWQASPKTSLSARLRYQSDEMVDSVSQARSPAWATLDVSLNHKLGQSSTLFLGVNNLTGRQRNFASDSDFGPVSGRFIYIGAKFAFGNAL